jgi:hypothetical protein
MKPHQKREVVDELAWHCSNPRDVYELLTDQERSDILKKGYVTKDMWAKIKSRITKPAGPREQVDPDALFTLDL